MTNYPPLLTEAVPTTDWSITNHANYLGYVLLGWVISPSSILPTPSLDHSTRLGGQTHSSFDPSSSLALLQAALWHHPSRLVTLPLHYTKASSPLERGESGWLDWAPSFPGWLNGPSWWVKCKVLDLVCKGGSDKAFLTEGVGLLVVFKVCHHDFHLLHDVGALLIILLVMVDIGEESPVIKVIDGILEDGICCSVAPKVIMEPRGEQLHWFVSGIIGRGIWFNDPSLLLSLHISMESCDSPIIELLDEAGKLLCAIVEGDSKV